jgi:FAD:protein FMN transferase
VAHLVAPVMGTTVSFDVRHPAVGPAALGEALAVLEAIEERFSTFRPGSEISRLGRGEISIDDCHPDVREVMAACAVLRAESGGAFDAVRDGRLDPSGYVKGWAAERAADLLRAAGARDFSVNIGGDIVCAGEPEVGRPWRVGVRGPADATSILLVLGVRDGAVATSGLYERGTHVAHAATGEIPALWRSVTVLAPDLATADAVATAALAMGEAGPAWAAARPGCEVAAVDGAGRLMTTPGIERVRAA